MFSTNTIGYSIIFYVITLLFFLFDLIEFFLINTIFIPFLMSFYCTLLIYYYHRFSLLLTVGGLLFLESFCFYNNLIFALIYIIPIHLFAFFFHKNIYQSPLHSIFLSILGGIIQIYTLDASFSSISWLDYTIIKISSILIVSICFSLKINKWARQDNRA